MKKMAWMIKDIEDIQPQYREVTVSFEDPEKFPGINAEVKIRMGIEDVPISRIKTSAIDQARAFLKAI